VLPADAPEPWGVPVFFDSFARSLRSSRITPNVIHLFFSTALLIGVTSTAWGAGLFPSIVSYPRTASSVAIADVTGDGIADLAAADGASTVSVLPGSPGGLGAAVAYTTGPMPNFITFADVTGDGRLDMLVANAGDLSLPPSVPGSVSVFPGLAGGGLGARSDYGSGINPLALAVGDVDGDSRVDIAVCNSASDRVSILYGLPGGGFGPGVSYVAAASPGGLPPNFTSIAIGDLNGDGRQDVAVGAGLGNVTVLYGLAGGGFAPYVEYDSQGESFGVTIRDLDGDGRQDLVACGEFTGIGVFRGLPGGTLDARADYGNGVFAPYGGLVVQDLNGDGRLDMATGTVNNTENGNVGVLFGLAGGGFGMETEYKAGGQVVSIAVGDLDGDGRPDIAAADANYSAGPSITIVPSRATVGFLASGYYPVGSVHAGLAVSDLTGDGRPDAVMTDPSTQPLVATLTGMSDGSLGDGTSFGPARSGRSIAVGDMNGDGRKDLVVLTASPGTVALLPGLAGGGFGANTDYATAGTSTRDLVLADLNGDGFLDVIVSHTANTNVSVFLGQPGGLLGPRTDYTGGSTTGSNDIAVGDLDGDGIPDLALLNGSVGLFIFPGDGAGGFGPSTFYPTPTVLRRNMAIADVNSDGRGDVLVLSGGTTAPGLLSVYLGLAGGGLSPRTDYPTGIAPLSVAAGDLDGDGLIDVAVGVNGTAAVPASVSVLLGIGGGSLGPRTDYGAIDPRVMVIGDMTADGRPDLVLGNSLPNTFVAFSLNTVGIMPNTGPALAVNHAPAVTAPAVASATAGSPVQIMASASDPDGLQTVSISSTVTPPAPWLVAYGGVAAALPVVTASRAGTPGGSNGGTYTITWTATDNASPNASATVATILTVTGSANQPPVVTITAPASGAIFAVGTSVGFAGSFTDEAGDTHTAVWSFDGITIPGVVNETTGVVTASYTFTAAGVYSVSLTVTDNSSASGFADTVDGLDAMVVIYDPSAGFVTGGGWIQSPPGAYPADPDLTGRANFGFVSKYKKGATVPSGETEFQFSAASMEFHSSVFQWLVVSGARAQYKGSGSITGATGAFDFILTATDGQISGGGGVDKIRMKIWDHEIGTVVYDNQPGAPDSDAPTTALGGGNIVIQTNKNQASEAAAATATFALLPNRPNPFNPQTSIDYSVASASRVLIRVFDTAGRLVATLVDRDQAPGRYATAWNGRTASGEFAASGSYFVLMQAGANTARLKMTLMK
jgi:VCBS repeat protein/PKD domain-containing protein/flagellar hook capping protein FlgD